MAHYKYERLSAQDNDFLLWEKPNLPMHGGSTQIFEAGPLRTDEGGIDFANMKRGIEGIIHEIPRYRQKLSWIPGEQRAVWVDDPYFSLDYHMRHTSLPRPGSEEQLKRLTARIFERPLDRERALWEMWIVEGLPGGRFASIGKTHHCMMDGISGLDVARTLMSTTRDYEIAPPRRFVPRPVPSSRELQRDEWLRRLAMPLRAAGQLRDFAQSSADLPGEVVSRLKAVGQMAMWKAVPASETPLNGPVGPHRRIDWLTLPLAEIKAIRKALDTSVNDVVLAIVTGAVREFLISRRVRPAELDFRVATPVNVRTSGDEEAGNRVSSWIVRLPIGVPDPGKQLAEIHVATERLKRAQSETAIDMLEAIHEWLPIDIQSLSKGTQNLFVTNVPGPQFPLYMMGAELLDLFVHPPLIENLGLVVGVFSYNGKVSFTLVADYDRLPDLSDFAALMRTSFEKLAEAAGVTIEGQRPVEIHSPGKSGNGSDGEAGTAG